MANSKAPSIVVTGIGPKRTHAFSIALDLDDTEKALALAKRLADQTGRIVSVWDADGELWKYSRVQRGIRER